MAPMETELDRLRKRLRSIKTTEWERIAREAGVTQSLPRKIVYETRRNFGTRTIAPLVAYFREEKQAA